MVPRNWVPARVQTCGDAVVGHGTIPPAANIVFSGPDDFHGRMHRFCNLDGFHHEFRGGTAATTKPTPEHRGVNVHLVRVQTCKRSEEHTSELQSHSDL